MGPYSSPNRGGASDSPATTDDNAPRLIVGREASRSSLARWRSFRTTVTQTWLHGLAAVASPPLPGASLAPRVAVRTPQARRRPPGCRSISPDASIAAPAQAVPSRPSWSSREVTCCHPADATKRPYANGRPILAHYHAGRNDPFALRSAHSWPRKCRPFDYRQLQATLHECLAVWVTACHACYYCGCILPIRYGLEREKPAPNERRPLRPTIRERADAHSRNQVDAC